MQQIFHRTAKSAELTVLQKPKNGAWIHVVEPTDSELDELANRFDLERDLLQDAVDLYESPRIEEEDGAIYVFTRYSAPDGVEIATEPLLVIVTHEHIFSIQRRRSDVLDKLTAPNSRVVTTQRTKMLLQIINAVTSSYRGPINRINRRVFTLRAQLKKTEIRNDDFIYLIDMEEDLHEFLSALGPQAQMLQNLSSGRHLRLFEDDSDLVEDISLSNAELTELASAKLKTISATREAYATIMANNLNRIFKRLTSIGIFMTIPTVTAGLYGMNVALPFGTSRFAFWYVLAMIAGICSVMIWLFNRRKWL